MDTKMVTATEMTTATQMMTATEMMTVPKLTGNENPVTESMDRAG